MLPLADYDCFVVTGILIEYGLKTAIWDLRFESSVISSGSKTQAGVDEALHRFESSVISSGSKTFVKSHVVHSCLRVV